MIVGLLLAAGRGARFGGDKLLAELAGRPVIHWSAATVGAEVDALYVVVPAGDVARRVAVASLAAVIVEHPRPGEGMASSIRQGVAALPVNVDAVVVALADQPLVSREVVRRLCARWRVGGASAVAPAYLDGRGHPVLFGRSTFAALRALEGDGGARVVLDGLGGETALVPVDATMPADVDTPDALRAVSATLGETPPNSSG